MQLQIHTSSSYFFILLFRKQDQILWDMLLVGSMHRFSVWHSISIIFLKICPFPCRFYLSHGENLPKSFWMVWKANCYLHMPINDWSLIFSKADL